MEELAEGFLRTFFRIFKLVFLEWFLDGACYFVGKMVLRLITLGKYPDKQQCEHHEIRISLFGFAVIVAVVAIIAQFFS